MGNDFTKHLIDPSYDCLGILLCVRLNQHLAFELQRRKCPVADGYINSTNMLLWPRFQLAMDMHIESVRRSAASLSGGSRATLSLTNLAAESKGSTAPHVLTQRFGQFLQGILALGSDENIASVTGEATTSDIEPGGRSLERLRGEFEAFLIKVSKGLAQGRRARFLGNNYSLGIWATLDGDILMKQATTEDFDHRIAEDMEYEAFPHAVLEIRWEGQSVPDLVQLLNASHLVS